MTNSAGLYIHIPFCERKCNYCDFYSTFPTDKLLDDYCSCLIEKITQWGGRINRPIDTIYLGGGTPSLLNHRLVPLINSVKKSFKVQKNCEITLEINPSQNAEEVLKNAKEAGVNRLSIGIQSCDDKTLKILGRTHTFAQVKHTFFIARGLGFQNISVDLMLGLPFSNKQTLIYDLENITALKPEHISSYILKIEPKTAFFGKEKSLELPCDDLVAEQYLLMCEFLENRGYEHYEISNFAKKDMQSRHNLKYWNCEEYLGIGPSAHSFLNKKRFYYSRDLKGFLKGDEPICDGDGGDSQEYIMLALRLWKGVNATEYKNRFKKNLSKAFIDKCRIFEQAEYMKIENQSYSLTNKGMLLSNNIISELLECIE